MEKIHKNLNKGIVAKVITLGFLFQSIIYMFLLGIILMIDHSQMRIINTNKSLLYSLWAITAAPVLEEIIFREGIYTELKNKFSIKKATLISSVIFGVIHIEPFLIIFGTIMGIISCKLYEKFKEITYSVIFHSTCNLFSCTLVMPIINIVYTLNQSNYRISIGLIVMLFFVEGYLFVRIYKNIFSTY